MSDPDSFLEVADIPVCVDLDGTLTPVDTLHEALLVLVRQTPSAIPMLPIWLFSGKARFKREIASRIRCDATHLPLNTELIDWLKDQRAAGRRLVLATAADGIIAESIAARIGLFDEIIASDGKLNLSAAAKGAALVERFGNRGFDYVGNERSDEPVWRVARKAIVVGSPAQAARAQRITDVDRVFAATAVGVRSRLKALRVHQWVKNVLVFLPAVLAHKIFLPTIFFKSTLAFLAFGLCASSVYLINDLLDLEADRRHPRKRKRPAASGALSAQSAMLAALVLLCSSVLTALLVNWRFATMLLGYFALTLSYSLRLKRAALVDVMTLAALYTIRIIGGAAATRIPLSFWLLAFSVFIFLSLGFVKRYTEIVEVPPDGKAKLLGRGYHMSDLPLLMNLGVSSGFCTVVVMALYINSTDSQTLYRHNKPLWLICPLLLYWISRVWLLTTRGQMPDDPVVFALRDRNSILVLGLLGMILFVSI